jgi:NAD(P)H-dependent FMN reductase
MIRTLVIPGSLRQSAYSKSLAALVSKILEECDSFSTVVDLSMYDIPLYNQDLEDTQGFPEGVTRLQTECIEHDLIIFVSPEYNGSIPGVLKNTIDWLSRTNPVLAGSVLQGKVTGLLASSPGRLGGVRVLRHLRDVLSHVGMIVLPGDRAFAHIDTTLNQYTLEFSERHQLEPVVKQWVTLTQKLL